MSIDNRLKNYWHAVRGLRMRSAADREKWLKGPFALALTLEKDPRLRQRLMNIQHHELNKPA